MATENPKVVAYISEQVYEQILSLREQWQLKSMSQVVSGILQDYFGIDPFPKGSDLGGATITQRVAAVENDIKQISTGLVEINEMINHLNLELKTLQRSLASETQELNGDAYSRKRISRTPQVTPLAPHRSTELAQRLGVSKSTISVYKLREDFSEWTKTRDPQGIAWIYNPVTKQFNFLVLKEAPHCIED